MTLPGGISIATRNLIQWASGRFSCLPTNACLPDLSICGSRDVFGTMFGYEDTFGLFCTKIDTFIPPWHCRREKKTCGHHLWKSVSSRPSPPKVSSPRSHVTVCTRARGYAVTTTPGRVRRRRTVFGAAPVVFELDECPACSARNTWCPVTWNDRVRETRPFGKTAGQR